MAEYNVHESEKRWQEYWENRGIYKFSNKKKGRIFSIDTPPPTVSGRMHIGHAFSYSQQDFIVRFRRMSEGSVFYPFGTDDNGLPTERLIERMKNVKSKQMPRQEFIGLCLKTLKEITPEFVQDWKNLGISADYAIHYSTIDKNSQRISQASFIELFRKGYVYKKEFPTIWCPECQTAIAQAELEDKEQASLFTTIKFSVAGKEILISTTRPELMPACVAVFVNPRDKRYSHLVGNKATVPLFKHEVPIIADESASMEKGTGVLMICSYGDRFDVDAINRHKLKPRVILNKDGTLNSTGYKGMRVKEARKRILDDLRNANLIAEQKQISNVVNVHDKCGTEIEFLPTEQWFIKILDKKKELIEQGKKIGWHPEFMLKRYENWVNGLEWDWNISRERHFGVPIPIWECKKCKEIILPKEEELPVDPLQKEKKCQKCKEKANGEERVLDTWATSSLTPQIAASLTKNKVSIPYSLRPQAHDIIRTWAFYTIAKSCLHEKKIPWGEIMISGFVTLQGQKMSKSKGNVIEPQDIISKYGADALRYWAASSKLGEDIEYQEKEIISGKKFITKIWNASKLVFTNFKYNKKPNNLAEIDRLFISKLNKVIEEATKGFEEYEYARAKSAVVNFFWHVFCDNYLEIVKRRVYSGTDREKESACFTLYNSLLAILKMMAPITPYIAEEIYQEHFKGYEREKSIHISKWPEKTAIREKRDDEEVLELILSIISEARQIKSKAQKSMKTPVKITLERGKLERIAAFIDDLKSVTNAAEIKEGSFSITLLE